MKTVLNDSKTTNYCGNGANNPVNRIAPNGRTNFEVNGKVIGNDGKMNGTKKSWFNQFPSFVDVENAGTGTHYVFGRGDGKVYVYTSGGVQAVIPMKRFVNSKR